MKAEQFRSRYEAFRGKYWEFGNYRIYEPNRNSPHYECEHAGNVFTYAPMFEDAVNKCRRHSATSPDLTPDSTTV